MPQKKYATERMTVAVDCVIFGFDGETVKLLLIRRGFAPRKNKWSLMGGFVGPREGLEEAAGRILHQLTGLEGFYLEQLYTFGHPQRDPVERTISVAFFSLIDIQQYEKKLSDQYHPEWFPLDQLPPLIFDHLEIVALAKEKLQYNAALHPILFELLPEKFTVPQLLNLYEAVYGKELDKRNFTRKLKSSGLLIQLKEKERESSKKGAYYYKLNKRKYNPNSRAFISFLPTKGILQS